MLILGIYGFVCFIFLNILDVDQLPDNVLYRKLHAFLYTIFEYLSFTLLLRSYIENKIIKRIINLISLLFIIFQIIFFTYYRVEKLDSVPVGVEIVLMFIFIFLFFFESLKTSKNIYIYNIPCFWVAVGILLYLGAAFFPFVLANDIPMKELEKYWDLTYIAEILKNILFVIAIFLYSTSKETLHTSKSQVPYLDMN